MHQISSRAANQQVIIFSPVLTSTRRIYKMEIPHRRRPHTPPVRRSRPRTLYRLLCNKPRVRGIQPFGRAYNRHTCLMHTKIVRQNHNTEPHAPRVCEDDSTQPIRGTRSAGIHEIIYEYIPFKAATLLTFLNYLPQTWKEERVWFFCLSLSIWWYVFFESPGEKCMLIRRSGVNENGKRSWGWWAHQRANILSGSYKYI